MLKKLVSMLVAMTLLLGTNTTISAEEISTNEMPPYEITDEYVRIDYIEYEIVNNTIQYEGDTYEIVEYSLVRYEKDGTPVVIPLPVEQTKITDPERIAELNALVRENNQVRAVPQNAIDLPYTETVSKGQWMEQTLVFNIIKTQFYYYTILRLYDFPLFAEREFDIRFIYCTPGGNWHEDEAIRNWTVSMFGGEVKYSNTTEMRYGQFIITNLYGDPSPKYTYNIKLWNIGDEI